MYDIITQLVGLVGVALAISAYQFKRHSVVMVMIAISDFCFVVQFFMLGAYAGSIVNFISIFRNLVFAYLIKHKKKVLPYTVLFCSITLVAIILTWAGPICILAILGNVAISLAFSVENPKLLRYLSLPSSFCWIIYDIYYFSLGGILMETFTVISIFVALFRLRKSEKKSNPPTQEQH